MKITAIHIDGFGVWHDRDWQGLSSGVNVFHGPNEAGKSTLMSFVRAVFFGFERRNHPRRYEPLDGGNHGGVLDVANHGDPIRIERKSGRHVRGKVRIQRASGETGDETDLERLLAGTTRTLYHNVFAFGLEELEQFRTLEESEVASHIAGAGMGVGASRWSAVWKDLEDRRSSLFLPRGQNSTINRALGELAAVGEELDRTEAEPEEYVEAHEQRTRLDREIRELEARVQDLGKKTDHFEKLREAEPHRRRRSQLQKQLQQLEPVERFPEGGVERLNMLVHQRRQLESEVNDARSEGRQSREERTRLAAKYTPQELLRRDRLIEALRAQHLPGREVADERVTSTREAHDAIQAAHVATLVRRDAEGPPSPMVTIAFATVVAVAAAALFWVGNAIAGTGVSSALLLIVFWYYQRARRGARIDRELRDISARLEAAENNARGAETESKRIEELLRKLTGKEAFSYADLESEAVKVRALTTMADRIRSIDESLAAEDRQNERLGAKVVEVDEAIRTLLAEAGAASESDFLRWAEIFGRRQKLIAELERTPSGEVKTDDAELAAIEHVDPDALGESKLALSAAVERLETCRTEVGRLEERIETLSGSEERSRARARRETIVARVDEAAEKWAVLTLCRTLLDETRRFYETDRQPEVLQFASAFLSGMSGGRWVRVVASLGSEELVVESATGDRVSPENLSRGTAEQLYLSMRLALVREYSHHVEPLPVIFDDIFVNFDPERTRRAIESVRDLSETHQILLFTCHPHLVELVQDVVPQASVYPL
jgi:uncharacterized protein YhaN